MRSLASGGAVLALCLAAAVTAAAQAPSPASPAPQSPAASSPAAPGSASPAAGAAATQPGTAQPVAAQSIAGQVGAIRDADIPPADLREFRVGMPQSELPHQGYKDFHCVQGGAAIAGWDENTRCPADAQGEHDVSFRYDDPSGDTKVAGQPVLLSLDIGADGRVDVLHISTDPKARLFLHKRAFLFGEQVMARYGEHGWACTDTPPAPDQEPVGGVFIQQRCERSLGGRHMVVERSLYRHPGSAPADFTSASNFTITLDPRHAG